MTWVLLLFIWGQDGITAEFNSEERCLDAAKKLLSIEAAWYDAKNQKWVQSTDRHMRLGYQRHFYICTPK